jgi:hypothetical protein
MADFAKIGNDNIVLSVLHLENSKITDENGVEQESLGQAHLEKHNNWPANQWIQSSNDTRKNKHLTGDHTKAFRGNGAAIGYTWMPSKNIFMPPKQYPSWVLNETDARWQSPIGDQPTLDTYNTLTHFYRWNETNTTWDLLSYADEGIEVTTPNDQPADVFGMPWYIWTQ